MCPPVPERDQIICLIERLMDADLLFPEEGALLLEEIEMGRQAGDLLDGGDTPVALLREVLAILAQPDCSGALDRQVVLATACALVHSGSASTTLLAHSIRHS